MEKLAAEGFELSKHTMQSLEKQLADLEERRVRIEGEATSYENALLSGENDARLVFSLRESFAGLEDIAFERGKIEARMDDIRALELEKTESQEDQAHDDDWVERLALAGDRAPFSEKSPEPELVNNERAAASENDWWQHNDPQERAAAQQKYQDWVRSRDDPNHVDDLDEPTPARPR